MSKGCKIEKNKIGKIVAVKDQSGNKSSLFQQIFNIPTLSLNEAIDAYKNIYSEQLKNKVQFQVIGQKGAQNLDQIEEATFRMDNLKVAREMEASGKTPKEIRLATGWEKGVDGLFRYEIQDGSIKDVTLNYTNNNKMFETPTANIKLSELYFNQELFKAYPQLKNTEVVFYDTKNELYNTNFLFVLNDKIYINKEYYEGFKLANKPTNLYNAPTPSKAIAHELSHIIQNIEGFAVGSSRKFNEDKIRESITFFRNNPQGDKLRSGYDAEYDKYLRRILERKLSREIVDNIYSPNGLDIEAVVKNIAQTAYENFAGEAEARNTEKRFFMSPQERLEQTLQETQDIPFEDQFVLQFKNNMQSSQRTAPQIIQEIIDKLKQNGLSEDVFLLSTEEINAKLIELGVEADVRKSIIDYQTQRQFLLEQQSIAIEEDDYETADFYEKAIEKIDSFEALVREENFDIDKDNPQIWKNRNTTFNLGSDGNYYFSDKEDNLLKIKGGFNKSNGNFPINVLDLKGEIVGKIELKLTKDGSYASKMVMVKPEYQRKGIASAMYDFALRENIVIKKSNELLDDGKSFWSNVKLQKSLKNVGINLITNGLTYKDSKTGKDIVILNKDTATDETLVHEFSHIFSKWQKENRPELWKAGQNLAKNAIKSGEIQEIVDYVKQTQPKLKEGSEAFYDEVLQEFISRESKNMMDEQKRKSPLMQWLSDFWASIKDMLSLTSMTPEQVANLNLRDFARASVVDLLKGERIKGEEAQEYFTRNADRLPLTLSVFNRLEFKDLQGRMVNPQTVTNYLNQSGIKQIEKDLIKQVIQDNFQGQKKISYDELEAVVRANIMPLERIETSSYANYGMDNLGSGNYGEAKTLILNAPIEHGVTGHFSGDFKASGRKNIKYQPKQLDANTWVAVEEGYEANANDSNIYQYVGTAGTKEAVDAWINNYSKLNGEWVVFEDQYYRGEGYLPSKPLKAFNTEEEANQWIAENKDNYQGLLDYIEQDQIESGVNKGMFGHIRVWQDGEVFIVSELQSDYFQKQYVVEDMTQQVVNSDKYSFTAEQKAEYNAIFRDMIKYRQTYFEQRDYLKGRYKNDLSKATKEELEALETYKKNYEEKKTQYEKTVVSKARPLFEKDQKQFIASQKEWEKRMVREAIKEASLSGATSLRFPTPYTLSVIEGYIKGSTNSDGNTDLTYKRKGDIFEYNFGDYPKEVIVVSENDNEVELWVIGDGDTTQADSLEEFLEQYEDYNEGEKIDLVENTLAEYNGFTSRYYYDVEKGIVYHNDYDSETIARTAEEQVKTEFSMESLSETQQTVARKYEQIAEILKQERGDNFETVTDENRFDWYETKIEASETQNPVIAFQVIGEKGASRIEEYNNLLNQAKELEKQGKDYSETGWYKGVDGWKYLSKEAIEDFKIINKEENKILKLKEVLGNENTLFKIYPEIQNLSVIFLNKNAKNYEKFEPIDKNTRGEFQAENEVIRLNTNYQGNRASIQEISFVIGHEVAHRIQRLESFSRGGNSTTILNESLSILNIDNTGNLGLLYQQIKNADKSNLTKNQLKIVNDSFKTIEALWRNDSSVLIGQYKNLMGEIDANIVGDLVNKGTATGTYSDLLALYLDDNSIDPESVYFISGGNIQFSLRNQPQTQVIEPSPNFNGYPTYKEAVDNTPLNEKIEIRIDDVVLAEVNANNSINDLIRQGIIEDRRELEPNGNITYKTSGATLAMKIINANIARQVLGGKVNKSGDIRTEQKKEVVFSDSFEENKKEFGDNTALSILASDALANNTPAFGVGRIITEEIEIPSETVLMTKLKNLLNQLGIKSMNLDAWEKRFGQKANSNALADIANRIVAFADGQFNEDTLSEETSHFIIEAFDQEKIKPLLDLVHKTDEWKQYSQTYMEIYKDEAIVRREILGKVLKNALQERAQKQETLQGQSVVDRIVGLFVNFIESIRNLFTDNYRQQLNKFTDEVYDKLMAEELFDELRPEQFDGNKLVMFQTQVNDTVAQSIEKLLKQVGVVDRKLNSAQKESLQKINDNLDLQDEASQLHAVSGLASVLKKHITYLNTRGKKQGFLSTEESFVYNTTEDIGKALQAIIPKLEVSKLKKYKEQAIASAKEALASLSELTSNLNQEKEDRFEEIVVDLAERNGLSQQQQDVLLKEIRTQSRDTNVLEAWFGGVIHAQNPILNMLAKRLSRMNKEINILSSQGFNKFFSDMSEIGYKSEEVASLMKKWAKGNYLFSPYDFVAEEKESNKIRLDTIKSIAPEVYEKYLKELKTEDKVIEDFTKNTDVWYADLSQEQNSNYRFLSNEAIKKAGLRIDALNTAERQEFDNAMEKLNLSLRTKKFIQEFKDKKNKVFRESKLNNGFSEEGLQQLQEINADFQVLFDIYDVDGNIKEGLSIDKDNIVTSTVNKEDLNEDTRTALELNQYREALKTLYSGKDRNVFEGFFNQLDEVRNSTNDLAERKIKAENFIKLNTRVFYTEDFWKQSDKGETVVDKLLEQASEEADKVAGDIQKFNIKLRNILKRNKMYNRPSQIDYDIVSAADESEIKDLVEKLETKFREAKTFLTKEESGNIERKFQSVTNDSYKNELFNNGLREKNNNLSDEELREKIDFITKHVTYSSKQAISRMIDKINSYNETRDVPKGLYITKEALLADRNKAIIEYAESKLMPYFKTLQSTQKGADTAELDLINEMVNAKSAQELESIYNKYKENFFLDASPSFIFEDADTSDRLNKEYKKRLEENEPLLSDRFLNKDFFNYFGIDIKQGFSINTAVATKNQKEFEAWKLTVAFQEESLDFNKVKGKHNKYLLPQYRRGTFARAQQIASGLSKDKIKEAFNDAFTYREDDPAMGQTVDGDIAQLYQKNSLIIPKTGLKKLEDTETTDELLYSYMLMRKEAVKFDRRVDTWADVEAMEHYIKGKTYGDKTGEATTTYKKFNDFKRYNIYGQRETFAWEIDMFGALEKKKNLAPVINSFQNFVRNNNLAFSILTPMTSFLQGTTNFFVEHTVGDRINRDAARLAAREVPKLITEATGEFFNVTKKAKLNLLLQFMGQDNPFEAFENSNYGKALRGASINKAGYLTHFIGDVPIQAQTLLTILHDYRIVNGDITDYYSWRRRNRSLTEKDAKAQWKTYQDDVMYKHIVPNKDGSMEVSQIVQNIEGWENKVQQMRDRLTVAKQDIDNQISEGDKGMVQRHAMLSWTTLHKGWLVSSMTKRFKAQHLNLHNNMMEEGTYRGTAKFVVSFIKDLKKKGLKNAFKDNFRGYDGGYKLKEEKIYDNNGVLLRTEYIPIDDKGIQVASIEGLTNLKMSNNKVYSQNTYKGSNWNNLTPVKIILKDGKYITDAGTEVSSDNAKEIMTDYYEELKFDFAKMRQISVARAGLDFLVTTVLAAAGILLSKMADDDDDDYAKEFMAYATYRLASEVTSQSYAIPAQAYAFLESPTVGMSQLQNTLDVLDIFDTDGIKRGTYKGLSKNEAWFLKMTPGFKEAWKVYNIDRTRRSYEFFNEKNLKFTVTGQMMLED